MNNMQWCACSTGLAAVVLINILPWLAGQQMVYLVSLCPLPQDCYARAPAILNCWNMAMSSHWPDIYLQDSDPGIIEVGQLSLLLLKGIQAHLSKCCAAQARPGANSVG